VEANSTGGQGSRRAVAPRDDDDDDGTSRTGNLVLLLRSVILQPVHSLLCHVTGNI
jgi:hypothetical protein